MIDTAASDALQRLQGEILESIARGEELAEVARQICLGAERLAPQALCTILTVDAERALHPLAAPGLPEAYSRALDGVRVGPAVGSCGTAIWRGEAVEVTDIANDPLWNDYRALAIPLGIQACWSSPIQTRDGQVVGAFAFYYRTRRGPADLERRIVAACVHLCAIAIEREEYQSRIRRLAYFDALTGLPNRVEFRERAGRLLATLDPAHRVALLCVNLDDFKSVNDSLGQASGDKLLQEVARRLVAGVASDTIVARSGGDEFRILDPCSEASARDTWLAQHIIAALDAPFDIDDAQISIKASIGIALAPAATPMPELGKRADMALSEAKRDNHGSWRVFEPAMESAAQSRSSLKQDLRRAFDAEAFSLVYQPILTLETNALCGVETLLRWQHPRHGAISPGIFIPIAEEMGMIGALGDWVLREACRAAARWPRAIKVGVNLSPLQLRKTGFILDVVSAMHQAGLPAERLDLEVTESALLARDVATRTSLHELHDLGVRLSLDDFGTGYSSLQSLRSFPFDRLKIDMSFVRDIGIDADSTAIIRAIIGLARDLGLKTTAEGVEEPVQLAWLVKHGCDEGQGHYFSLPLDGAALQALLERAERDEELIVPGLEQATIADAAN